MKRRVFLGFVAFFALALMAQVWAGGKQEAASAPAPSQKVLGISLPAADHGWVAAIIYYAQQEAKALGVKYILATGASPAQQSSQVDDLIAQKVSAILINPSDTAPLTPAAQRILNAHIPLIDFDRRVNVTPTFYLGGNNPGIGVNAAKFIGKKLNGKGTVVVIGVPAYGSVSTERVNAFKQTLSKDFPDIKIAGEYGAENSSKAAGLKIMSNILVAIPHIDAVFTIDDELSIGVIQAIHEANRTDVKVETGAGGAQVYFNAIKTEKGMTLATFLYSPTMIKEAVKYAVDIMNGKTPPSKSIIIPATLVTKANVDKYLDPKSPY